MYLKKLIFFIGFFLRSLNPAKTLADISFILYWPIQAVQVISRKETIENKCKQLTQTVYLVFVLTNEDLVEP